MRTLPLLALATSTFGTLLNAQRVQLNAQLGRGARGDVVDQRASPDGRFVVYSAALHAQRIQLNAPLERVVVGKVIEQQVSPDGRFLVYAADPADTGLARLHRTAPDGTGPVLDLGVSIRLGDPGALEPGLFQLSADGGRVVFRSAIEGSSLRFELHGIPSDGSAAPVLLSAPLVEGGGVSGFRISADGRWVVYRADQQAVGRFELLAVPITGGRAVRVNGPLFEHGDVQEDFVIGPDSRSVFFRANPGSSAAMDLFRGSMGGRQPTRLHPVVGSQRRVLDFLVGPDGARVLYRAYRHAQDPVQLFSVPADASGAPVVLNQTLASGGSVSGFELARDGKSVVYIAPPATAGFEAPALFVVPIDRSRSPRRLSPAIGAPSSVLDFQLDPLGHRAVFRFRKTVVGLPELYSASLQEPAPPVRLDRDDRPDLGVAERLFLAPDGARVLYTKGEVLATRGPLFSAPIDGLLEAVALAPDVDSLSFQGFGADGMRAVFGLTSFRVDGSDVPLVLDPGAYEDVVGRPFGKDLLYRASRVTSSLGPYVRTDLFRVPIDGSAAPARINRPFPLGPIGEEVIEFDVASRARRAAYRTTSGKVFGVDLDGLTPPRLLALAEPGSSTLLFSPDGRRVVFHSGPELVSAALDGDAAPTVLGPGLLGLAITPDSRRVVYWVLEGIANVLHSAPLDGSAAPVRLDEPARSSSNVQTTPDSSRIVFQAFLGGSTRGLFSVPSDGSAPPTDLGGMFPSDLGVASARLSPDGQRVVFQTRELDALPALVSVRVDGSGAPVLLAVAAFSGFHIDATSQTVVFLAQGEISRVPITVGAPLLLTPPAFATAYRLQLSADGTRAVFLANRTFVSASQTIYDVFAVPVDASQLPVKLNAAAAGPGDRFGSSDVLFVGPAGHALFPEFVDPSPGSNPLLSAPLGGGESPALVAPSLPDLVLFTPDGLTSVFHQRTTSGPSLFASATDGGGALRDLSGPAHSSFSGLELTADGSSAVYASDLDEAGVSELYQSFLVRYRRSPPPATR